ncbi:MAG: PDR/VanB family oxidoreductase [Burkholderiaceae bacterium]|nr:PDR/VanB family oxidoreductase [Burkholderiaceae bacterium]
MSTPTLLTLRVRALTWEAEGILGIELVPLQPNTLLPDFEAGAHIDLHLPDGLVRSYSLLNAPGERQRWCIAVNRDAASRGGSRWIHEQLRCGQTLTVGAPRNHFPLNEAAPLSVFIAGGIGITPILGMIRRLEALGQPWRLHYACRDRAHAAYVAELQALSEAAQAAGRDGTLDLHFDAERGRVLDLPGLVAALPPASHLYACGPKGLLAAYEAATAAWPREQVHLEYFAAQEAAATEGGYQVELQRSARSLQVRPGETLLDRLLAEGVDVLYSCREGVCGTCEVRVLEGEPDHRDLVLGAAERAANTRMMVCCSGARSARLVLDL